MLMRPKGFVKVYKNQRLICQGKNLVTTGGFELLAKIIGGIGTLPSHMAIGNAGASTQPTMTALQGTELERVALAATTVSSNSVSYRAAFGAAISITVTVREIGIFNSAAGGEMLCRFICSGFDLSAGESAQVDWTMTIDDQEG